MFQLTSKTTGEAVYFTDSYEAARQIEYTHNARVHELMNSGRFKQMSEWGHNPTRLHEWQIEEIE
jgi:hypothetical protein